MSNRNVIHLLSVAGSDRELIRQLGLTSASQLIGFVQDVVGPTYRVTGNTRLMNAVVDAHRGGRKDDAARAADLQKALADDHVRAMVSLRGGAWLTRILPRVDFTVLRKRRTTIHVFGFSELTALVNVLAAYDCVRAYYDFGPGYLLWALRDYALANHAALSAGMESVPHAQSAPVPPADRAPDARGFAMGWAKANFRLEFAAFFLDVLDIIAGRGSNRVLSGRPAGASLPTPRTIRVVGGCLSTLVALLGSPFQDHLVGGGPWLALEDIAEPIYRIDRYLAQLKLSGVLQACAGVLLGDFHHAEEDQTSAVVRLLKYHLPENRAVPIITGCNFGHCYPAAPLPLNQPLELCTAPGEAPHQVRFHWPAERS